jgi:hypothetical protein
MYKALDGGGEESRYTYLSAVRSMFSQRVLVCFTEAVLPSHGRWLDVVFCVGVCTPSPEALLAWNVRGFGGSVSRGRAPQKKIIDGL